MFYNLIYPFHTDFSWLNVFRYITFRSIGSAVTAGTGVGVDDPERRRLFAHVFGDLQQDEVFQHVGVVAGVKGMAVAEHRGGAWFGE